MRETLGNRISKKLKEYGISQRLLATLSHTNEVSVSRYVNDKRIPKADVLYRIACALHTTTDYLLGLTTSEQTNEEWIKSANTEQLAEFLNLIIRVGPYENEPKDFWEHVYGRGGEHGAKSIVTWLKQTHKPIS